MIDNNDGLLDVVTIFGTFLHDASTYGKYDVVKYLVEKGIDFNVHYAIGELENVDAYEYARQYGQTEIAEYLKSKLEENV